MKTIDEARNFFKQDLYATKTTGIHIDEVSKGYAKCSFSIEDRHKNAADSVMGGAIFTLADFTFAVAANFDQPLTVTLSSSINFISVAKGSILIAEARCIKETRSTTFFEIKVTDDLNQLVATISSTGFKKAPIKS